MRVRFIGVLLLLLWPAAVGAQDFGVMGSAETINRGNFKLMANPIWVLPEGEGNNDFGVTLLAGYGFTDRLDGEFKVSLFDNVKFVGGDLRYWLVRNRGVDVSVAGGLHFGFGDPGVADTAGVDLTFEASGHVAPVIELYAALDFAFNGFDRGLFDNDYTTAHLVPGIEVALSRDLDFVAEGGIRLNDDSSNYVSFGLAYYIR